MAVEHRTTGPFAIKDHHQLIAATEGTLPFMTNTM